MALGLGWKEQKGPASQGTAWAKAGSGKSPLGAKSRSVPGQRRCDFQWQRLGGVR